MKFETQKGLRPGLVGKHNGYGDTLFINEGFLKINGKQHYLWWVLTS